MLKKCHKKYHAETKTAGQRLFSVENSSTCIVIQTISVGTLDESSSQGLHGGGGGGRSGKAGQWLGMFLLKDSN